MSNICDTQYKVRGSRKPKADTRGADDLDDYDYGEDEEDEDYEFEDENTADSEEDKNQ